MCQEVHCQKSISPSVLSDLRKGHTCTAIDNAPNTFAFPQRRKGHCCCRSPLRENQWNVPPISLATSWWSHSLTSPPVRTEQHRTQLPSIQIARGPPPPIDCRLHGSVSTPFEEIASIQIFHFHGILLQHTLGWDLAMEKTYRYHDVMEEKLSSGGRIRQIPGVSSRSSCPLESDISDFSIHPYDNTELIQKELISLSDPVPLNESQAPDASWYQWLDRKVCISGVKHGVLRYYGRTQFAEGMWCGVELDEAVGKNNGTVNGVQYFNAKPNHGIFAPVTKVSKVEEECSDPLAFNPAGINCKLAHAKPYFYEGTQHKQILKQSSSDPSFVQLSASTKYFSNRIDFDVCLGDKRSFTEQQQLTGLGKKSESDNMFKYSDTSGNCKTLPCSSSNENLTFGSRCARASSARSFNEAVLHPSTLNAKHKTEESGVFRSLFTASSFDNANCGKSSCMVDRNGKLKQSSSFPQESNSFSPSDKTAANTSEQLDLSIVELAMDNLGKEHQNDVFPLASFLINKPEELDDDQMSLDFDESLGILTPNEMKDFTVCGDQPPTSCTDLRTFKFPSSESFDDITDIPDDEQVRDIKVQYIADLALSSKKLATEKGDKIFDKSSLNDTGKFLRSISELLSDSESDKNCLPCNTHHDSIREIQSINFYSPDSKEDFEKAFLDCEKGKCDFKYSEPTLSFSDIKLPPCTEVPEESDSFFEGRLNGTTAAFSTKLDGNESKSPDTDQRVRIRSCKSQVNGNIHQCPLHTKAFNGSEVNEQNCDANGSRDSLLHGEQEHPLSKEKVSVSWEDCMERDTEEMFPRVERPESVYTVGSNDTGYQEDGEFDAEGVMTTSTDSTEISKRFSALSRDSCLPTEDVYRAADSTSTSGYSTGLCDSYCNEENLKTRGDDPFREHEISESLEFPFLEESSASHTMIVEELCDTEKIGHSETVSEFSNITDVDTVRFSDDTPSGTHEMPSDDIKCESDAVLLDETLIEAVVSNIERVLNSEVPPKDVEVPAIHAAEFSDVTKEPLVDTCQPSAVVSTREFAEGKPSPKSERDHLPSLISPRNKKPERATTPEGSPSKSKRGSEPTDKVKLVTKSPKKNVMSKIKAMIEATSCKTLSRNKSETEHSDKKVLAVPKRSRWEAVTSKIAASLAEEKTKPKAKREIKSRVDSNLPVVKVSGICKSPKLDAAKVAEVDGCSSSSVSSKGTKDKRRYSAVQRKEQNVTEMHRSRSPRPCGKQCVSSRSVSPAPGSESSTTVSLTSHNSKSKIPIWKGSTSTIASSVAPVQVPVRKPQQSANLPPAKVTTGTTRCAAKATFRRNSEQHNGRVLLHHPSPKPIRPPMWLSKAELSQEIQHLGRLCESRTKELNLLKMKLKHASLGFNAFAVLVKYLTDDLDALSHPQLLIQLAEAHEALRVAKNDLGCYEKNLEKLQNQHAKELTELSERLLQVYQSELQELISKQNEEIKFMREQHEKKVELLHENYRISSNEAQIVHEKTVEEIKQKFFKQTQEEENLHQNERALLEKRHLEYQQSLQSEIEQLKLQFTESKRQSRNMEEALHKDTDSKLQWIAAKKADLEKEVDSLKAVLEMRSKEIHSLRKENLEMQKELEELPVVKERVKMLEARAEDLQALMTEKIRMERQLSTEHQVMKETYEKETRVNKRLSMENEELQWRLKQNVENISSLNTSASCSLNTSPVSSINLNTGCTELPEKSPVPASPHVAPTSRSVFFTFIDPAEMESGSPQSPKSHYKRVNPPISSPCRQASPDKSRFFISSSKKVKESCESSPVKTGPRKISKHFTRKNKVLSQQGLTQGEGNGKINDCQTFSSAVENMQLPTASCSVALSFMEKCSEQINGGNVEDLQTQSQSPEIERNQNISDERSFQMDSDRSASYGEATDAKKYYHMTFPVLKEAGQDCDADEGNHDLLMDDRNKSYLVNQELGLVITNCKANFQNSEMINNMENPACVTTGSKNSQSMNNGNAECCRTSVSDEESNILPNSLFQNEYASIKTLESKELIDVDCKDM